MHILLAEDDETSARFVRDALTGECHRVHVVFDGQTALAACLEATDGAAFDLAVLDRTMPGRDGLSVAMALREAGASIPILFLTALGDVEDRVEGLLAGGDDYLVKPFDKAELIARVTALGRRARSPDIPLKLVVHDLELDLLARKAYRAGEPIELKVKEFTLLEFLMRHAGQMVTKTMLLEKVWNFHFDPQTSVVETHVSRLRAKVDRPFGEHLIRTTRNAGYMIAPPQPAGAPALTRPRDGPPHAF